MFANRIFLVILAIFLFNFSYFKNSTLFNDLYFYSSEFLDGDNLSSFINGIEDGEKENYKLNNINDWEKNNNIVIFRGPLNHKNYGLFNELSKKLWYTIGYNTFIKIFRDGGQLINLRFIINSTGGDFYFLTKIDEKLRIARITKTKTECLVVKLAASSALYLTSRCDQVYFLNKSWVMWHKASTPFSRKESKNGELEKISRDFEHAEDYKIIKKYNIKEEDFLTHKKLGSIWPIEVFKERFGNNINLIKGDFSLPDEFERPFYPLYWDKSTVYIDEISDGERAFLKFIFGKNRVVTPQILFDVY